MNDVPPQLLEALLAGDRAAAAYSPDEGNNAVADLLVSQTETADIVLLNKVDLAENSDELETIDQIVRALNAKATVKRTTLCDVPLGEILAAAGGKGVVEAGVVDDHRDAIQAAEAKLQRELNGHSLDPAEACNDPDCTNTSHSHSHKHAAEVCNDSDCTDTSHSHSHEHAAESCSDPGCTDTSHSHSHAHTAESCSDPDCTDTSHSHSHNHDEICNDPGCTDTSHSHSHSHATTLEDLGIGSFVYRARKPFHPQRLVSFLRYLPISRGLPDKAQSEAALEMSEVAKTALQQVVRSKGFVWLGDSNIAANYWSHAGSSFEMQCLGRWWSTLSREEVRCNLILVRSILQKKTVSHRSRPIFKFSGHLRPKLLFFPTSMIPTTKKVQTHR
jgi:G3E family GTPase